MAYDSNKGYLGTFQEVVAQVERNAIDLCSHFESVHPSEDILSTKFDLKLDEILEAGENFTDEANEPIFEGITKDEFALIQLGKLASLKPLNIPNRMYYGIIQDYFLSSDVVMDYCMSLSGHNPVPPEEILDVINNYSNSDKIRQKLTDVKFIWGKGAPLRRNSPYKQEGELSEEEQNAPLEIENMRDYLLEKIESVKQKIGDKPSH
jgi:hypothetical protein